jgi:hypothetical protein
MYKIQSILVPKNMYTKQEASNWVFKYFVLKKIDETEDYFRFKQIDPQYLKNKGFNKVKNKMLDNGIFLVIYYKDAFDDI